MIRRYKTVQDRKWDKSKWCKQDYPGQDGTKQDVRHEKVKDMMLEEQRQKNIERDLISAAEFGS